MNRESALIAAAAGIGDIIRVTPLIRVAHSLGYHVDVLLFPDDAASAELLRGAPEVRRLLACGSRTRANLPAEIARLREERYSVACFTMLSARASHLITAKLKLFFDRSWYAEGDAASVAKLARSIGWQGPLPRPFAMKSARDFGLPKGTIALHPGCKANWPWKKWHGFDELAEHFANVVVVGRALDRDNSRTYFKRPFSWPGHVRDYTEKLGLRDLAALLSECSALISLDSGIMHLGVALGVPTFGIFGITNPARECIPSDFMTPITKGLPCEAQCRRGPWGRRDCEYHLACLKTLSPADVASRVVGASVV